MSSAPLRVGVLGVGKMGELHLRKYLELSGVEIAGVHDTSPERLADVAARYGVKAFEHSRELCFESDAVSIATPTGTHFAVAREAIESGTHLLLEKPIAETVAEAETLEAMAREKQLVLQVGLIERFRYRALAGNLCRGRVRFIEAQRLSPHLSRDARSDVVTDLMIHDLDLALALVGEDPSHVSATGVSVLTDALDMASVRLDFPSGAAVNLGVSRVSQEPVRKFRVFFDDAYASFDFIENSVKVYRRGANREIERDRKENLAVDALRDQLADFVECIREGRPPIVSGADGVRALRSAKIIVQKVLERQLGRPEAPSSRPTRSGEA